MKNRNSHLLACVFAATAFFSACNTNSTTGAYKSETTDSTTVNSSPPASQPKADTGFMKDAADGGLMEVLLGKVAMKNAKNQQVKDFGSMMVTDHTKAGDELKSLASAEGVVLPDSLSAHHQKMLDKMAQKTGDDFDKDYIRMMVNDHEEDINDFKKEASGGKDSVISAFASRTLPTLQKHLDAAKEAQKSLGTNP